MTYYDRSTRAALSDMPLETEAAWRIRYGVVEWFNAQKGHGFIQPSVRAGLQGLEDNQKVSDDVMDERARSAGSSKMPAGRCHSDLTNASLATSGM